MHTLTGTAAVPVWINEVVKSYAGDDTIKELIVQYTVVKDRGTAYSFKNNILRFKNKVVVGKATSLRQDIIATFHKSELEGHSGERATYQSVKLVFHWS